MKNPGLWTAIAEGRLEAEHDAEGAQRWNAAQITQAVRHFVFDVETSDDAWGEKRILQSLGPRVHPAVIRILADQSFRAKLTIPTGTGLLPEAPINRLCDLLDDHPPGDVVDLLIPFLNDPSSQIRIRRPAACNQVTDVRDADAHSPSMKTGRGENLTGRWWQTSHTGRAESVFARPGGDW
ncbi:MAG: hypothetical protein ACR2OZ_01275 [Verrucomicrobiales bacterium]